MCEMKHGDNDRGERSSREQDQLGALDPQISLEIWTAVSSCLQCQQKDNPDNRGRTVLFIIMHVTANDSWGM